ncbi:hypothetical protein [Dyella acidiphila]|uniref:Tol-pal system protein YbgF n=1 Tax=Dyella acidiphila TaxID=2775866 RepID=A0ABR9GFU8_9GAMM|nr:hypothetical protein [Dyella acidiphila]MBE1162914.1 hypothetical protein [Dyella acidiphila]
MHRNALVVVSGLLVSALAVAGPQAASSSTAGAPAVARMNQRIAQHQAEVDHLQQNVGQQESASREAADRLQQQDRTIAALRQQLKAAQDAAGKPAAGH